jgi:hypothetical protein
MATSSVPTKASHLRNRVLERRFLIHRTRFEILLHRVPSRRLQLRVDGADVVVEKTVAYPQHRFWLCTQVAARGGSPEGAWCMGSKTHDDMPLEDGVGPWAALAVFVLTLGVDGWTVDHPPWSQEQATHQSLSLIPIAVA